LAKLAAGNLFFTKVQKSSWDAIAKSRTINAKGRRQIDGLFNGTGGGTY